MQFSDSAAHFTLTFLFFMYFASGIRTGTQRPKVLNNFIFEKKVKRNEKEINNCSRVKWIFMLLYICIFAMIFFSCEIPRFLRQREMHG